MPAKRRAPVGVEMLGGDTRRFRRLALASDDFPPPGLLSKPGVAQPVAGPSHRNPQQWRAALRAVKLDEIGVERLIEGIPKAQRMQAVELWQLCESRELFEVESQEERKLWRPKFDFAAGLSRLVEDHISSNPAYSPVELKAAASSLQRKLDRWYLAADGEHGLSLPKTAKHSSPTGRPIKADDVTKWLDQLDKHVRPGQCVGAARLWNALAASGYLVHASKNWTMRPGILNALDELVVAAAAPGSAEGSAIDNASSALRALLQKHLLRHENLEGAFEKVIPKKSVVDKVPPNDRLHYRDWFHSFSGIVSLLASRAHDSERVPRKHALALLKAGLMLGQQQATYETRVAHKFERVLSPLVVEGYARGVRTALWDAAKHIREAELKQAWGDKANNYVVYPVSRAFTDAALPTRTVTAGEKLPPENGDESLYLPHLGVQLVPKDKVSRGLIDRYLGSRGLRSSTSESATICATYLAEQIEAGQAHNALALLGKSFSEPYAAGMRSALQVLEVEPNSMISPAGLDTLAQSSDDQMDKLIDAVNLCKVLSQQPLPFYCSQNLAVISNLIGDVRTFAGKGIPATVCVTLTDALKQAVIMVNDVKEGRTSSGRGNAGTFQDQAMAMERFYQVMQTVHHMVRTQLSVRDDAPTLEASLTAALPEPLRDKAAVWSAPHALAMMDQVVNALKSQLTTPIAYLAGGYYEMPALLKTDRLPQEVATVDALDAAKHQVVLVEPHPNNAGAFEVHPHDPVALIHRLMKDHNSDTAAPAPRTLLVDATLNHLNESQMQEMLRIAEPFISNGRLNLVVLQSGTKFFQNGMDIASIGVAVIMNKGEHWASFNEAMQVSRMAVPQDEQRYFAALLAPANAEASENYLRRIRENTTLMREALSPIDFESNSDNAFELCINTDPDTVYIAFRPTDAYIQRKLDLNGSAPTAEQRAKVNMELYETKVLPAYADLSAVDRSSFGFNVTNFGECGQTVRITLGIEEPPLINEYANRLIDLGHDLMGNVSSNPA